MAPRWLRKTTDEKEGQQAETESDRGRHPEGSRRDDETHLGGADGGGEGRGAEDGRMEKKKIGEKER